jgi:outer membrane protein
MDTLKVELKGIMDDYKANQSKWNAAKQQQVEKDIQAKQKQFNDYQQAISQQAQQEDQQLTQGVLNQVNAYIEAYGKKYHYKIIFGANGSGTIVYGTDAIDITDTILKGLNKEYNGGA